MKTASLVEKALGLYLCGKGPAPTEEEFGENIHREVEIGILPGYASSNLDAMWIQQTGNTRLNIGLSPGPQLTHFFTVINVHPRDVLKSHHMGMKPVEKESYLSDAYRHYCNISNANVVRELLDLLTNFETDPKRPAICSPDTATVIIDNAFYGGYPLIAGYARVSDVLALDFSSPIRVGGKFQVGIHDSMNGSGHMESGECVAFELKLNRGDLIALRTKGHAPDGVYGLVKSYYKLGLESTTNAVPA